MLHGPCQFWVLVPATKPAHFAERYGTGYPFKLEGDPYASAAIGDAGHAIESGASLAQQRLDIELQRLHEAGAEADGEVGDPNPLKAISNALSRQRFDEIILSTLPRGRSRWLRQDLPGQVTKKSGIPVTHVVSG
jgi:GABA permease